MFIHKNTKNNLELWIKGAGKERKRNDQGNKRFRNNSCNKGNVHTGKSFSFAGHGQGT